MSKAILIFACVFAMCVKPPEHVGVSEKSVKVFAETIKEKNLAVLAIGGFYLRNKVEKMYLDVEYNGVLTKEVAREKLVSYLVGMVAHLNQDADLLPHLIKDRLDYGDISVSLAYTSVDGKSSQVHLYNSEIVFSTYHLEDNFLETDYKEPFVAQ